MAQLDINSDYQVDIRSLLGLGVAVLIGAVATAAGVGGGAIYIPLFNIVVGFALKPSTALSQACITAASLAAVASNLPRTHPELPGTPLIDFPLMLLLTPLLLVGVGIGVLLNGALPSWLLNILLLVLLVLLLVQAVAKGRALWQQETKRAQAAAEATACQYTESSNGTTYSHVIIGSSGIFNRQSLLAADRRDFSSHSSSNAATAVPPSPGLRLRRVQVYNGPRGPRGLEPEQEASLSCLDGLDVDGIAIVRSDATLPTAGMSSSGVHHCSTEGPRDGLYDVSAWDVPPLSSFRLPLSTFFVAGARPALSTGDGASVLRARPSGGVQRMGITGGDPSAAAWRDVPFPPSWRAFNELGANFSENALEGALEGEDGGGGRGRRCPNRLVDARSRSVPLPPVARLLLQLLRRSSNPQLQTATSSSHSSSVVLRRWKARRTSFDPSTGANVMAAAASTNAMEAGVEEAGPPTDSWLQRRSKWRTRFPLAALHNYGALRSAHLHRSPYPLPPFTTARGQQQLMLLPDRLDTGSLSASSRLSGSGLPQLRSRSLRSNEGDGGADGAVASDEIRLGTHTDSQNGGHVAVADPRTDAGGVLPVAGGGRGGADTPSGPGCFTAVSDGYRPPIRLATLHEEFDDRGEVRPDGAGPITHPANNLSEQDWKATMQIGTATMRPQSPLLEATTATAGSFILPVLPIHLLNTSQWELLRRPLSVPQDPLEASIWYNRSFDHDRTGAANATEMDLAGPVGYIRIEIGPADDDAADVVGREAKPLARVFVEAARKWMEPWKAALRRIPRRFAGGLILAWVVYLALQVARAFQPLCSPAWWTLLVIQYVTMLGISAVALVTIVAAMSCNREGEVSSGGQGEDGTAALPPSPPVDTPVADEQELGLNNTAALLVLQAPLSTLCATFGAGLTGGMLGLGGGMVMGPLLLQIGVHPQVTAASSGAMVLFSSSAALIQFMLQHGLNLTYAAIFGAASLLAGLLGSHAVARAIRRSGRPSLVVLALAGVMAVGAVCVAVFGLRQAVELLSSGELGFVGACSTVSRE